MASGCMCEDKFVIFWRPSRIMDHLWAPWRQAYVATLKPSTPDDPCFICQGLLEQDDRKNLVVVRKRLSVVVLNRFPYKNGHLLVAPRQHKGNLDEFTS